MKNISPSQMDFLKEMGSIGVGHAATGLASVLGKRIAITNPLVHCLALENVVEYLGGAEQIVSGLLLKITGDISGSIMLIFPKNTSLALLNLWFAGQAPVTTPLSAFYESALKELGNIATGAYLTALGNLTGNTLLCSTPFLATDMLGSLLDEVLIDTAAEEDSVIVIDNQFIIEKKAIQGFILLMMTPESIAKIFTKMEVT